MSEEYLVGILEKMKASMSEEEWETFILELAQDYRKASWIAVIRAFEIGQTHG